MVESKQVSTWGRWAAAIRCSAIVIAAASGWAQAAPFSAVQAFGDSLSDNGNFYAASGQVLPVALPPPPYFQGRFSNGPVAVEYLAAKFGVPLFDHAFGGATSGLTNAQVPPQAGALHLTGLLSQVNSFVGGAPVDPSALFLVWAGSNDFLTGDLNQAPAIIAQAVTNLSTAVGTLYAAGARQFLLPLMPNLGLTPEAQAGGPAAVGALTAISAAFAGALSSAYEGLEGMLPGASFTIFDTFSAQNALVANAAAFGITNTTDACFSGFVDQPGVVCADPNSHFFWDRNHPSALVHRILGDQFAAAVPAPGSLVLALAAMVLLATRSGRRSRPS